MKAFISLFLTASVFAFPNKFYNVIPQLIDQVAVTTDVKVQNTALGSCICDITSNSCDAYCCCDPDCNKDILTMWNNNYDNYCAKNFIGSTFRPLQKCIDKKHIYNYHKRMGMAIDETET